MSSIVPSPPVSPDADATTRGVVNPTATDQTLGVGAAIHRFANLVVGAVATLAETVTNLVRATGVALVLRSDVGTGATDVSVKLGTSRTDGDTNQNAKLWSARTGIGATEVEYAYLQKNFFSLGGASSNSGKNAFAAAKGNAIWEFSQGLANLTPTFALRNTSGKACGLYTGTTFSSFFFDAAGFFTISSETRANIDGGNAGGGTPIVQVAAGLVTLCSRLSVLDRIDVLGGDSSASPGNATINKPTGKSAIASGATSVTITNSNVAAGDQVFITWHGDLGTQSKIPWVTTAAGSFTVNVGTAPGSAVAFCWVVSKRI